MSPTRRRRERELVETAGEIADELGEAAEVLGEVAHELTLRFLDWFAGEPAETLVRARRGDITRRTARTPLERRAVHRAAYERRRASRHPGESVRSRLGHGTAPSVTWSAVPTTSGVVELTTTSRVESRRVGQHSRDVQVLLGGASGEEDFADLARRFHRRWSRRIRTAGGYELEADPLVVVALLAEAGPAPEPYYTRLTVRRAA